MCSSPSVSRTYSTKSLEVDGRVTPVRWSRTLSALEPGHEVDAVAADIGVGAPGSVVQGERRGCLLQSLLYDLLREEDALAGRIEGQPRLEQAFA